MPGSFATGLTEGLLNGFSKAQQQKSQLETQQKSQDIQTALSVIHSGLPVDSPAVVEAAQKLQDIMQGKKPGGKSNGGLALPIQQMLKMIGHSQKPQDQQAPQPQVGATRDAPADQMVPGGGGMRPKTQQRPQQQAPGGWTENISPGGPAPGTGGSMPSPAPLNASPNGSSTLQSESAPPTNAYSPLIYEARKAVDQAEKLLKQYEGKNDYLSSVRREQAQTALDAAQKKVDTLEEKQAAAETTEANRETMASMQAQFKSDMAAAAQQGKEELQRTQAEWKDKFEKQATEDKAKLTKQIDDDRKEREVLVAQMKGKASPKGAGAASPASQSGQAIEKKAAASPGLDADAWDYGLTRHLPQVGSNNKDAVAYKTDIVNRWRQIMKTTDMDPSDIVALRSASSADKTALSKMTSLDASVNQFEGTLERNLKLSEQLNKSFDRTDYKFANRVEAYLRGEKSDPAVTNFMAQLYTMAPEYAKIMAGSTSSAGATVSGTEEAKSMFNAYISKNGIQSLFDNVIRPDMANRKAAIEQEKKQKLDDLRGKNAVQNVGAGGGRGGNSQPSTIHFKEGSDSYDIPAAEVDGFKKLHPQAQAVQ